MMLSYIHGTVISSFPQYACPCLIKKEGVKMTIDNNCIQLTQSIFDSPQKIEKIVNRLNNCILKNGLIEKVFREENGTFEDVDTMAQKVLSMVD